VPEVSVLQRAPEGGAEVGVPVFCFNSLDARRGAPRRSGRVCSEGFVVMGALRKWESFGN